MKKRTIITCLFVMIAMTGQGQITCHVEGILDTDAWGDDIIICEEGTDLRVIDEPRFHIHAIDGRFTYDIETDFPRLYNVFFLNQFKTGKFYVGKFLTENCDVNVTMYEDQPMRVISNGEEGRKQQVRDSIEQIHCGNSPKERLPFRLNYAKEHPMLCTLYDVLDAIHTLCHASIYTDFDASQWEAYLTLYHDKLVDMYPDHPIHEQIATVKAAYRLQPGKPYIDYNVRNNDGQLVPISTMIKGKVALVDLWASWCGPCRRHSIAMIPIYERYKDQGFTVVAIARERNRDALEKAVKKDGYPWICLLELNDENQIWRKNGIDRSGGAMFLIDCDGTILSTSTNAEELESLIYKSLNNKQL